MRSNHRLAQVWPDLDDPNPEQDVGAAQMRWTSSSPFHTDRHDDGGVARVVVDGLEIGPLPVDAVFGYVSLAEQVLLADADLNDPRLVHARNANVLEDTVIKLTLPGLLNDNFVPSI